MRNRLNLKRPLSVLCLFLGFSSCAAIPDGPPGMALDADGKPVPEAEIKAPFMIREAGLPQGFPAPGPVDQIILKEYPGYRAAKVEASAGEKDKEANEMFWPLFRHISDNHIAMSSPVEMTYSPDVPKKDAQPLAMAFLYGDPTLGQPVAPPQEGGVGVIDVPAMTVLSVAVRGGYNSANFTKGVTQLRAWLDKYPGRYEVAGPPRFMGYNSPFVPGLIKIGEVQLPVKVAAGG